MKVKSSGPRDRKPEGSNSLKKKSVPEIINQQSVDLKPTFQICRLKLETDAVTTSQVLMLYGNSAQLLLF